MQMISKRNDEVVVGERSVIGSLVGRWRKVNEWCKDFGKCLQQSVTGS